VLASDGMALEFLRSEFPHLKAYKLPSYNVQYTSEKLVVNAARNWRGVVSAIRREQRDIERILLNERVTAIISDNRYGCYRGGLPSVIVTHQLKFRTGITVVDKFAETMVRQWLGPFDRIWVPDDEQRTLSVELSMSTDPRVKCIGWQSTLSSSSITPRVKLAAVISGPEPQRTNLEKEVRSQLEKLDFPVVLVRGIRGFDEPRQKGHLTVYDFMDRKGIDRLLSQTEVVVCRTGYSSLMDLKSAGKKAILIPTPGQPEQTYLGRHLQDDPHYIVQEQGKIDIHHALCELSDRQSPEPVPQNSELLHDAIMDFFALYETHDQD